MSNEEPKDYKQLNLEENEKYYHGKKLIKKLQKKNLMKI
jgi:hypothetical protein